MAAHYLGQEGMRDIKVPDMGARAHPAGRFFLHIQA